MIRPARTADLPEVIRLGMQSLELGPYKDTIREEPQRAADLAVKIMASPQGCILLSENDALAVTGLFAFIVYPQIFTGDLVANELMWYVDPEERTDGAGLKLLWEAEQVAGKMGAKFMAVTSPTDAVAGLYKRFGYEQLEVAFLKPLGKEKPCHS